MLRFETVHMASFVSRSICGVTTALFVSTSSFAGGEIPFSSQILDVGGEPRCIAAADFNSDGRPDLAVGFRASDDVTPDELHILLQNADGGFDTVLMNADLPSFDFWDLTAGDVNDDGFTDLVLTFRGNIVPFVQSGVQVLLGDGAAGFTPLGDDDGFFATCAAAQFTSLADFDGDGDLDIAATAQLCFAVSILHNIDGQAFELVGTYGDAYHMHGSAPADFDLDGDIDVAGWSVGGYTKLVLNNGDGTFTQNQQGVNQFPVAEFPRAIAAVDLDLDGRVDMATTGNLAGVVTTLFNDVGELNFTRVDHEAGPPSTGLAVADLDGDNLPDLAVGSDDGQAVNVLRNLGERQFAAPQSIAMPGEINEVIAVDLNQDGAIDVAAVSETEGLIVLLMNETELDSPADLDGDGVVGTTDLLQLLGAWGGCPPKGDCPADLDADGSVGTTDLLIMLGNWG